MKRFTAMVIIAAMLSGCALRKPPNVAPVPGCDVPAYVYVPPGCYTSPIPNGVEVRCHDSTTIYKCKGKGPEADNPAK